ncbi:MAG: hypothetical protein ACYYKD_04425 [Rhodospirillales bacterium]
MTKYFALFAIAAVAVAATVIFGLSSAEASFWFTCPPGSPGGRGCFGF